MWRMILPIAMVVIANCFYHITTKKTPENANAFLSLAITYSVAALVSFAVFLVGSKGAELTAEIKKINWTSFALGVIIIGLELGYILVYRAGWDVSKAPLIANTCLAIALLVIGFLLFKEQITAKHIFGMALCIVGLVFISK